MSKLPDPTTAALEAIKLIQLNHQAGVITEQEMRSEFDRIRTSLLLLPPLSKYLEGKGSTPPPDGLIKPYDQAFHEETRRIAAELPGKLAPLMEAVVHAHAIVERHYLGDAVQPASDLEVGSTALKSVYRWLCRAREECGKLLDVTKPSKLSEYEKFIEHVATGNWDYTLTAKAQDLLGHVRPEPK